MTWKFQSGQEKQAKNSNCVCLLSTPPSLKHSRVVAVLGRLMVAPRVFFFLFFSPAAELKEEIILLTSESCFLSLATQMNYAPMLLSKNELDFSVSLGLGSLSSSFLFIFLI